MDTLLQRLEKAYKLLLDKGAVHNRVQLAKAINKTEAQVSKAFKEIPKYLTEGFLMAVADAFPDIINKEYMKTGNGDVEIRDTSDLIPHFPNISVAAGTLDGLDLPADEIELLPSPPGFGNADFSITVAGDSMSPAIEDGDHLYCRIHSDTANLPLNRICVIDSEQGGLVKVLEKATPQYLYLHSINPDYEDIKIHRREVRRIFNVIGLNRLYRP